MEAGVVPGAADGFRHQYALVEWSPIVGAFPAHGEPVRLDVDEEDRLSKRMTRNELTRTNAAGFYALCKVRAGQLNGIVAHFCWSSRFCARSRCATKAGATFV